MPFHIPFFSTATLAFYYSDSILLPSCRSFARYTYCVCLSTLTASCNSSSHHFGVLLHTTNCFPATLLAVVLTNCCHPSIVLAPGLSLSTWFSDVPILSNNSDHCTAFLPYIVGTLAVYVLRMYLFFVYSQSAWFSTAPIFDNSRLLTVCPY